MLESYQVPRPRKKAIHRTAEKWQALITEQEQSGITIKQFCLQHGITPSAFYNWRSKLNKAEQAQASEVVTDFVELGSTELMALIEGIDMSIKKRRKRYK